MLDIAIEGPGFLQVLDPQSQGVLFTRSGNLDINANGQLVIGSAHTGRLLDPSIDIPPEATAIEIGPAGQVMVQLPGTIELQQVGRSS